MASQLRRVSFRLRFVTIIVLLMLFAPGGRSHASNNFDMVSSSKNQNYEALCGGGSGETIEDAVIINTANSLVGIAAEYQYVARKCGRRNIDWKLKLQAHLEKNGKHYDLLTVELKNGEVRSYHFDITKFYGKF